MATNDGWETIVPSSTTAPTAKTSSDGWETIAPAKPTTTAVGTALRSAAETGVTVPGMMYGAGVGARLGATIGTAIEPGGGTAVGGFIGGVAGGLISGVAQSMGVDSLEEAVDKVFGTNIRGIKAAQAEQHPIAEKVGAFGGMVMGPGGAMVKASELLTKEGAKQAATGAGMMVGLGGAQRAIQGQNVLDPKEIASDVLMGAGTRASKLGERLVAAGRGQPRTSLHSTADEKPLQPETTSKVNSTPEEQKTFLDGLKANKAKKDAQAKVVQAAFKNNETGEIELHGPKHDENRKTETTDTHTQGFVDENGNFLDRKEAWNRAADLGQVEQTKPSQKDGLHTTDLREAGDKNFELFHIPETIEGVPVNIDRDMKRKTDGGVVGARFKRDTNEIGFNPEHTYQQFLDKAWTKPKVDGVFPIAENAFKTPQEWADFVLQHEAEHTKTPIAEGQTKAQYENQTNKAALEAIAAKKAKATGEPVAPVDPLIETKPAEPVVDRTKTDPRDVKSQQEFNDIAQEIYEKHGDTKAIEFFEGYKEYQKTWLEPIAETEKYTGINLRNKAANERVTSNNTKDLLDTAGKDVDLNKLTYDIDKGVTLTGKAKQVADKFRALMDELGKRALDAGVIKGWHEDYVARNVVSEGAAPPTALKEFMNDLFGMGGKGEGTKTTTKYGKERVLNTREDLVDHLNKMNAWLADKGEDYRFKLKTDNLAEIYHDYASSVEKAIENKKLVETLMQIRNPAGEALIREVNKDNPIPYNWKTLDSAQFAGMAVHPDMVPALKFVFDAPPGKLMEALGFVSQLTKRFNVVGSFFHAKSMMEVMSSAGIPIWTPLKEAVVLPVVEKAVKAVTGKELQLSAISKAVDQYRKGGVGDNVDKWLREAGLMLEVPEDVSKGMLTSIGKFADSMIGKYGPKTCALESTMSTVEKYTLGMFDKYTWDYLHTGGKIMVADAYLDKARMTAAKEGKPFDEAQQRKEIAKFVNESFGGLNWFDIATQSNNEFSKRMAMAAYSPKGRRALQVALFAPDWTISTLRAFTSALPKELNPTKWHPVEGVKGMMTPTTKADYARLYQFKTALTYFTLINGINMLTANRPSWENKDPTRIEWPDGTSMQAMKHAMEPYHWIADPDKTLASKLGFVPKALWVGLAGTEYASPQAQKLIAPSVTGNIKIDEALARGTTIAKSTLPFQAQAAMDSPKGEGVKRALLGTAGFPVYGKTPEQRKIDKEDRKLRSEQSAWDYHNAEIEAGREQRTAAHVKEGRRIERERTNLAKKKARLE